MQTRSASPVALVTGASAGIGAATVRALLPTHTVYAAARRVDRMAELAAQGARVLALDVTDDASNVAAIRRIHDEAGRLDVLVNNAGYGSYGAVEDVPPEEARRQFDVNVFGAARLIQLALPMMREQRSGTIVNVSSMGGKMYEPFGGWYHATKFALEGLSDCLRLELAPFGIRVVVIEPGGIKTEWGGIAVESLLRRSGSTAYGPHATAWSQVLVHGDATGSDPAVIAAAIVSAVKARRPKTRYVAGAFARPILALKWLLPDRLFDGVMTTVGRRYAKR
jgi:NAD(P)-dependent dehydrogenase (short-subunit alcohol dehydrogenase family)